MESVIIVVIGIILLMLAIVFLPITLLIIGPITLLIIGFSSGGFIGLILVAIFLVMIFKN